MAMRSATPAAQVGDDLVERLRVVGAREADAVLVGRVRERADGEHEPVVGQLGPGLQAHDAVVALDARDRVVAEVGVEVGRQLRRADSAAGARGRRARTPRGRGR